MSALSRFNKFMLTVELTTVIALQVLTIVMIITATVMLFVLAFRSVEHVANIGSVDDLLTLVQRSIAGILVVVLGLEILETLKAYFRDHYVRLEVILVVAIIAVGRHLVQVDFEHVAPLVLFGLSGVIVSLTVGYFLVKKALYAFPTEKSEVAGNE
jgi:uncharacterized membrane protein (DUF373 family)